MIQSKPPSNQYPIILASMRLHVTSKIELHFPGLFSFAASCLSCLLTTA